MSTINMHEAKSRLSRLVEQVETGQEPEVIIARNGRPAARLVPIVDIVPGQRVGVARGIFTVSETIDEVNEEIPKLFSEHKQGRFG